MFRSRINRKVAPKVRNGKVQKKNRHKPTVHGGYFLDRESPRRGFRHVVTKEHIRRFIELIPDWDELSVGIERIVLLGGSEDADGFYEDYHREQTGGIFLNAWPNKDSISYRKSFFLDHKKIFGRMGVKWEEEEDGNFQCWFSEKQARAYLLLHVFLHELGHHFDRIRRKIPDRCQYEEEFAETFTLERFETIFQKYQEQIEKVV